MNLNIKKRIEKIFAITRPPAARDTNAWRIILASNEKLKLELKDLQEAMFCKECVDLEIRNRLLLQDIRKLTKSLNECYSTIAALEAGNAELKKACNDCVYLKADSDIINAHIEKEQALELEIKKLENALTNLRLKDVEDWNELKTENDRLKDRNKVLKFEVKNLHRLSHKEMIGLQDRNGDDIYVGCKMKCIIDCCPDNDELTGIIKWAKYRASYTLQTKDGRTIAAFRSPPGFGIKCIKELPDGRIDGVIITEEKTKSKCHLCSETGKPCDSCGEYHSLISMCPPHEVRMKWAKKICPNCGVDAVNKKENKSMLAFRKWYDQFNNDCTSETEKRMQEKAWRGALKTVLRIKKNGDQLAYYNDDILMAIEGEIKKELGE